MSLLKRLEQGQGDEKGKKESGEDGGSRLSSLQSRRTAPPGGGGARETYFDLKTRVQNRLLSELDPAMDVSKTVEVRKTIQGLFEQILAEESIVLSRQERQRLFEQIVAEIIGLGPLSPLLEDDTITEIMVNGAKNIYVERKGRLTRVPISFESDDHDYCKAG